MKRLYIQILLKNLKCLSNLAVVSAMSQSTKWDICSLVPPATSSPLGLPKRYPTALPPQIRSGYPLVNCPENYGKSPFLMGNSTIHGHVQ